ncbi:non-ribosomal peptide synthetase [Streptomyces rimosus]|uniref:non-ribosomal peptide synthetase n=1 Tax=Streptomyces rimosus TaxID=1927 RepID=UPI0004C7FAE4|nr:non-ribosomal peptide synthetase [Streptomyces rimosus]
MNIPIRPPGDGTRPLPSVATGPAVPPPPAPGDGPYGWYRHWAASTPDAVAVDWGTGRWTYAALEEAATTLAEHLAPTVSRGAPVVACLDNSPALVAVAIAAARLGGFYLSLGPEPPSARVERFLRDLPAGCLITTADAPPPASDHSAGPELHLPSLPIHPLVAYTAYPLASRTRLPARTRHLCDTSFYAVGTSGSTGSPKCVGIPAEALATFLRACSHTYGLGPGNRHALGIWPAFDLHLAEIWMALTHGAAICIPPEPRETAHSVGATADWWRDAAITHTFLPTPVAELLFDQPWPQGLALKHLFVGGDRLRSWPPPGTTTRVHNIYGPAEATVFCVTRRLCPPVDGDGTGAPPIGEPVAGTTVGVVDPDGRTVPRGTSGELAVSGPQLAVGYLSGVNDPQERFAPLTLGADGQARRTYRTGDQVRMRDDEVLEFLGRLDDQVKISGVRIEPAEVETALEQCGCGVRQAVVMAGKNADGTTDRLIAFLRPAAGTNLDRQEVLRRLRAWLPAQAIPTDVRVVEAFPRTDNGKVDRRSLLDAPSAPGTAVPQKAAVPAATQADGPSPSPPEVTSLVLRTCEQLLHVRDLSLDDNFFRAGGSSLAAMKLIHTLESAFGVRLRVAEVLRRPDLAAIAQHVMERHAVLRPE